MSTDKFRFEVAVSFAGDNKREVVRRVMEILNEKIGPDKVFFDEWFLHELAGHDAQIVLQNIYRKKTRLVVSCVCERYGEKSWTQDEWRAIQAFERELRDADTENVKRMRFLPLRFDEGEVAGLFRTAIVPDVRNWSPEEIAELIMKRLHSAKSSSDESTIDSTLTSSASEATDNWTESTHPGRSTNRYGVPEVPLTYYPRRRRNEAIGRWLWLRRQWRDRSPIAITGPSGVGKSVIVAAICRSNVIGAMFPRGIIWLDCSDLSGLRLGLESVLCALSKESRTILDMSDGVSELQNHIHFRDTLLVFDNLDDEKLATLLEPLTRSSTILLTTAKRKVLYTLHCRGSKLRPFSLNDGVQLLKRVSKVQHDDVNFQQLQSVVRQSGQLPSLIVAAGSLIRSQPATWHRYLGECTEPTDGNQVTFSGRRLRRHDLWT